MGPPSIKAGPKQVTSGGIRVIATIATGIDSSQKMSTNPREKGSQKRGRKRLSNYFMKGINREIPRRVYSENLLESLTSMFFIRERSLSLLPLQQQ